MTLVKSEWPYEFSKWRWKRSFNFYCEGNKLSLPKTDAKDAFYRRREPWILQKIAGITEGKLLLLRVDCLVSRKQIVTS